MYCNKMAKVRSPSIRKALKEIAQKEEIKANPKALDLIAKKDVNRLIFTTPINNFTKRKNRFEIYNGCPSSISLILLLLIFFHSVRPLAFLPITIAAANEGLVNI